MYYSLPAASAAAVRIQNWIQCHYSVDCSMSRWHFHRHRPQYLDTCSALCCWLLCRSSSAMHYQTVCSIDCVSDSGCHPRAVAVGLQQHYLGWSPIPSLSSHCLQSVLNAAAWSLAILYCSDSVTSLLWLQVTERIRFKLVVMVCRGLYSSVTGYGFKNLPV